MDMTCIPSNLDYDNVVYMAIWMLREHTDASAQKDPEVSSDTQTHSFQCSFCQILSTVHDINASTCTCLQVLTCGVKLTDTWETPGISFA